MVAAVPPGGNWKDIPVSIPSKRLDQIRSSYAAGLGSRSTYYGRLHPDKPAYTISTYFSRPGNGAHIHYEQARVISSREAARLQSFPDSFAFHGSDTAVRRQIGNAVPPLLAFALAQGWGKPGLCLDLFSGAGGLSLGFHWQNWKSILASDIDRDALATYSSNFSSPTVLGDIRSASVQSDIVALTLEARKKSDNLPFLLLGGPPCQGYSTAGNRRSMDDNRNHLFNEYAALLHKTQPDGFLFENVPGLLSMQKGIVLNDIIESLSAVGYRVEKFLLDADEYGVPQRRKRLILAGAKSNDVSFAMPEPPTPRNSSLNFVGPSVSDALSDLPTIISGQDGSDFEYRSSPVGGYQHFLRNRISAADFIASYLDEARELAA